MTVMVGARGDTYGTVTVNVPSGLYKIKLVHQSGFLSCVNKVIKYPTNFGCRHATLDRIDMQITNEDNTVLLPGSKGYAHDGKISQSTFVTFNDAIQLIKGQKLRIWYKEDLINASLLDNSGSVRMFVLAIKQS